MEAINDIVKTQVGFIETELFVEAVKDTLSDQSSERKVKL